ncbi:tetratricopeptide repeat protein [Sphingobacterium sp. LRF_L2]|uniref:tetratricopeptide repeat protein n=1 Tax=Sphingobacterium sp. LRF_L2 TaxID=3369421 RepID=UPI003F634A58
MWGNNSNKITRYIFLFFLQFFLAGGLFDCQSKDVSDQDRFVQLFRDYHQRFEKENEQQETWELTSTEMQDALTSIAYQINLAKFYAERIGKENEKSRKLFDDVVEKAKLLPGKEVLTFALAQRGYYYYRMRKISLAMPDIIEAVFLLERNPKMEPPFSSEVYKQIGFFLGTIGDYEAANHFLRESLRNVGSADAKDRASLLDNIGYYTLKLKDTIGAQRYFEEALKVAVEKNDDIRHAKVLGNLALIAWGKGDKELAVDYFLNDVNLSVAKGDELNALYATNLLAKLLLEEGRVKEAKSYLKKVASFAESHENLIVHRHTVHQLLLEIAIKEGDEKNEVEERRRLYIMQDSLSMFDGENVTKQTAWLTERKMITERLKETNASYFIERKKSRWLIGIGGFVIVVSTAFYVFIMRRNKRRQAEDQFRMRNLVRETTVLDEELHRATLSLVEVNSSLEEKEFLIQNLENKLRLLEQHRDKSVSIDENLVELLASHLRTEDNWNQFRKAFVSVYLEFYQDLIATFPELSESNLRVIFLWKLNLTTQEISSLLGVTPEAVKKSKQRLRKKLGDERYQHFLSLLHTGVSS